MNRKHVTRYKKLVENINDAVYVVSTDTLTFTSVNKAAEILTGYKKDELLGMKIIKIVAPESLPIIKKMIKRKQKNNQATVYEIEIIKKDGSLVPVEISSIAIYENGVAIEILGVARDITERRIHERQRNVFISLISHEIKNPLTSMQLYMNLLKNRLKNDKISSTYISSVNQQMNLINNLLSDFLDISQMRMNKFDITKEKFELIEAISDVVKTFDRSLIITIEGKIHKKILGDRRRICQVLTNLLSNVVKYSPDNKNVVITVHEMQDKVVVGVRDFGPGIVKHDKKQLFNLFYRRAVHSKTDIKGHGLGLYICREIIKRHKGRIWVDSEPNQGSTFFFSLPV